MMNRIIRRVERDPLYRRLMGAQHPEPERRHRDAISAAAAQVAHTLSAAAIVTYTTSGSTALRAARERPEVPILCLTPKLETARRLALVWGTHCVDTRDVDSFSEMVDKACRIAREEGWRSRASAWSSPPACPSAPPAPPTCCASPGCPTRSYCSLTGVVGLSVTGIASVLPSGTHSGRSRLS